MPLLGKKLFASVKPLNITDPSEAIYTIPHTREQFRNKEDYEKRLALYKDSIWTCQCTGHVNLTHKEALDSELASKEMLKQSFLPCYEKPVLEEVHHSTESLDNLVDKTWIKLQQAYVKGELLVLKVKAGGKVIKGHVTRVEKLPELDRVASNCSSPSSDKENTNSESSNADTPKKWTPPKLHPYMYCIKLEGGEKIINSIPAIDLGRVDRPPSKDLLRLFIRAHAVRTGNAPTSPWVVDDDVVKEHGLVNKFAALFVSPLKMAELGRRSLEPTKKRKSNTKSTTKLSGQPSLKKSKTNKVDKNDKSKSSSPKKKSTPKKKNGPIDVDSDSSDDLTLAQVKKGETPKKTPKLKSPKKSVSKKKGTDSSDESESDLYTLASIKQGTPKKLESSAAKKKLSPKKGLSTPKKSSKNPSKKANERTPNKKKSLKQMTLFDIKKKTPSNTSKCPRPKIASPPRLPKIAVMLRKAIKEEKMQLIKQLLTKAARDLSAKQREKLPDDLKDKVLEKFEHLEHKRKLKTMTAEEKVAYLKEIKKKQKALRQQKHKQEKAKVEDQQLDLTPLPPPKLVPMPDGLPNECFGDVAMVTEFLRCFGGLLMPEDEYPIYSDALMKGLVSGKEGFVYLSRAVTTLLQTLLQDEIAEDYKELGVQLSEIPVNQYTASELVRLCLRRHDSEDVSDDEDSEEAMMFDIEEVSELLIGQLETSELFEIEATQKLQVLTGLCHRILGTYSVQDYMEDRQKDASALWREKIAELKEKKDQRKAEMEKKKEERQKMKEEKAKEGSTDKENKGETKNKGASAMNPICFYGGKAQEKCVEEEPEDLASIVKRRREMAAKAAEEKKEREKEEKARREKEYAVQREERDKENFQKKFDDGIALAKKVLRQGPIGTDRNHSRYWVFHHTTPGIFIEKGWASRDIDYSYTLPDSKPANINSDSDDEGDDDQTAATSTSDKNIETTVPHFGQNLWFTYDSVKDIDNLLETLHPRGYREGALKMEIKKKYEDVCKAVRAMQRNNLELRSCDGQEEMLTGFRQELLDTEIRLRSGGLGGVQDLEKFEQTLAKSTDIKKLGELMIEMQAGVMEKFLQGIMGKKKSKVKVEEKTENDEEGKSEDVEEDEVMPVGTQKWIEAVESASTLSRLHVLLGIMDSCIRWEKSAENAKCKICRRKGHDDKLLLCDDCNLPFHLFCLRPALSRIPDGDWFCPACIPDTQRRRSRVNYKTMMSTDSSESEEESSIEHEAECAVCGGDEDLVQCAQCPSSYHIYCHNPPLRHNPRGTWVCQPCKAGVKTRSGGGKNRKRRNVCKRPIYADESSSEEASPVKRTSSRTRRQRDYVEESSEEEPPSRTSSRGGRASRKQVSYAEESDNDSVEQPPAKSRRKSDTGMSNKEKLEKCEEILTRLIRHRSSWPFREPVDELEVPDYYSIIKNPMDLQAVKEKFDAYKTVDDFVSDIKLIIDNSFEYNHFSSEVGRCTQVFEKQLMDLIKNYFPWYSYTRGPVLADCL